MSDDIKDPLRMQLKTRNTNKKLTKEKRSITGSDRSRI
jgi:hypothetical protein